MNEPNRASALIYLGILVITLVCGCGPRLSQQELGTLVTDPAKLPGAGKPYPLPPAAKKPASGQNEPIPTPPGN